MKKLRIALLILLFPFFAKAQVTAIRFGKLVGGDGKTLSNAIIIVDGEKIIKVGNNVNIIPANAKLIDMRAYTAIPGLIDAHTHMTFYWDKAPGSKPWTQLG